MGVLSAVIVGPCVAPPLAAALIYLGRAGDPLTGGVALFALGLGMGAPLLVIGASAGRWLPRAGVWMESVKRAFGVVFLGLAIWFLERVVPPSTTLALWGVLLIGTAMYLGALEPLRDTATGWQRFWKGIGLSGLCYGIVLLVGAAAGASDPLRPLAPLTATRVAEAGALDAGFQAIKGSDELVAALAAAASAGQPALLDVYADWCIECKRLERNTFAAPEVQTALAGTRLLRADVTASDTTDMGLLKHLGLVGPPAVLFFGLDGQERSDARLVGYEGPVEFLARLQAPQP
jgi:thiol:disulfide interchange protein DsbD